MNSTLLRGCKRQVEKLFGCHIYRGKIPHGAEIFVDIDRAVGVKNIRTVFDIGANVGQTALHYAIRFPKADIYSFEPVRGTFEELTRTVRDQPRIHPYPYGIGRDRGEAVIHVSPINTNSSIVHGRPEDRNETIQIDSISRFCEEHKIETIDFAKIDAEGYELEVLAGAAPMLKSQRISFVYLECELLARTDYHVPFPRIAEFLVPLGYEPFGIYDQSLYWDGRKSLHFVNVVFICQRLIGSPRTA
jgi:FkbM family methyltransferase